MTIASVLARVEVDDLEAAVEQYRVFAAVDAVHRFAFGAIRLAWVGPFLLLSGPRDALLAARRSATLIVDDMAEARALVARAGGRTIEGPTDGPNGARLIVELPGPAVFELIAPGTSAATAEP